MKNSAIERVIIVAEALGEPLLERIVFIGGAIAPLLQIEPPFARARPTMDVDAIAATVGYADHESIRESLRSRGFREVGAFSHAHTWLTPGDDAVKFDLVPAGDHFGASGNRWDLVALENPTKKAVGNRLIIRHASPSAFLCLKLAAFNDRGIHDPFGSHDLEDVFALIVSRPDIVLEVAEASANIRKFIVDWASRLLASDQIDELLHAHLGNSYPSSVGTTASVARERLQGIANVGTDLESKR